MPLVFTHQSHLFHRSFCKIYTHLYIHTKPSLKRSFLLFRSSSGTFFTPITRFSRCDLAVKLHFMWMGVCNRVLLVFVGNLYFFLVFFRVLNPYLCVHLCILCLLVVYAHILLMKRLWNLYLYFFSLLWGFKRLINA